MKPLYTINEVNFSLNFLFDWIYTRIQATFDDDDGSGGGDGDGGCSVARGIPLTTAYTNTQTNHHKTHKYTILKHTLHTTIYTRAKLQNMINVFSLISRSLNTSQFGLAALFSKCNNH